jgi:hypothetical protein
VEGKAALFAMAAADSALTLFSAKPALPSLEVLPLDARLKNAAVSVVTYVVKAFLPSGLAVHYPLRPEGPRPRFHEHRVQVLLGLVAGGAEARVVPAAGAERDRALRVHAELRRLLVADEAELDVVGVPLLRERRGGR